MMCVRRWLLFALSTASIFPGLYAQPARLDVERRGDFLHLSGRLGFLGGKPLERLHDGATVTYVFFLAVVPAGGGTLLQREERFTVSFDLWEEKFAVVRAGSPLRSASHLSASAAEAWCLDHLALPLPPLPPDKTFVIKLDCRVERPENEAGAENRSALTLAALIDIFSRKGSEPELRWQALSPPVRLADLKDRNNERNRSR